MYIVGWILFDAYIVLCGITFNTLGFWILQAILFIGLLIMYYLFDS